MSAHAPLPADELLAHAGWNRRLALGIVADSATADDVVQATLVAAIERPPRSGVPLAPWLARVARNFAWKSRRGDARRERREALSARPDVAPADESLARAEAYRAVADAVVALDASYREVVLLRYFDGVETADIAARLGVPVETVRTRLKRAHAMLRARLSRGERDDRAVLALMIGGRGASPRGANQFARLAGSVVATGGALVGKKLVAAAVLIALLAGGAWLAATSGRAPRGADVAAADSGRSVAATSAAPATRRAKPDDAAPTASASEPSPPPPSKSSSTTWRLRGLCDGLDVGAAPPRLTVRPIEATAGEEADAEPIEVRADSAGAFDIDVTAFFAKGVPIAELAVDVDAPDYLPAALRVAVSHARRDPDGTRVVPLDVKLVRAFLLAGRVVDESGAAVAGAQVGAFPMGADGPARKPVDEATTGADGTFHLRLPGRERYVVVAFAPGRRPASIETAGDAGETPPLVVRPGASVSGRVVLGTREPLHGAVVRAQPEGLSSCMRLFDHGLAWIDGRATLCPAVAVADDEGRFVVAGLEPAKMCRIDVERIQSPWAMSDVLDECGRDVEPPAERVDLVIAAARLRVEARAGGVPAGRAGLAISSKSPSGGGTFTAVALDESGRRPVLLLPGATCRVRLHKEGFEPWERELVAPAAGEEVVLAADLATIPPQNAVVLTLKTPAGETLDRAAVKFVGAPSPDADAAWGPTVLAKDGRFVVKGVEPGRRHVVVRPGGDWQGGDATWLEAATDIDVPAAGDAAATIEVRRGGRLRVAARDAEGRLLQAHCVVRDARGIRIAATFVARHGHGNLTSSGTSLLGDAPCSVDPALPAGRYRIEFAAEGFRARFADTEVRVGDTTDIDVTLERE